MLIIQAVQFILACWVKRMLSLLCHRLNKFLRLLIWNSRKKMFFKLSLLNPVVCGFWCFMVFKVMRLGANNKYTMTRRDEIKTWYMSRVTSSTVHLIHLPLKNRLYVIVRKNSRKVLKIYFPHLFHIMFVGLLGKVFSRRFLQNVKCPLYM